MSGREIFKISKRRGRVKDEMGDNSSNLNSNDLGTEYKYL